nr:flavin reductase [uncultured Sellimonas sp.]
MNKKAMHKLSYGVFVITARQGEKDNGCITNTAVQVSMSPARISLAVNKENYTHDMILATKQFNVSVLSEKAGFDIFRNFGFQSGRDVDKFEDFKDVERAQNGIYYITEGTNAWMSAKVVQTVDIGTHTLFLAEVEDGDVLSEEPSATYAYYQEHIKPKPEKVKVKGWRCKICGYIYEGEELPADFICPICKHGADDFEKME